MFIIGVIMMVAAGWFLGRKKQVMIIIGYILATNGGIITGIGVTC